MKVLVSRREAKGRLMAPSSKSYTIRGLMCAALAKGESEIIHPLSSDDTEAALNVLGRIGVMIKKEADLWRVHGNNLHAPAGDLFCGDSAATLRFMTAICALVPGDCRLVAGPSLARRPVRPLVQALRSLGVDCASNGELPPVLVRGDKLRGGVAELPGNISSQFVSALLLIAPLAETDVIIRLTTPLESKPYILMTLDCLKEFGIQIDTAPDFMEFKASPQTYKPARYLVEGDWSSASYLLALGALTGPVTVENLNPESQQADKAMLELLKEMGVLVTIDKNLITVRKSGLNAIKADLSNCIDLLPTVAVLAAVASGVSELTGLERARIKESDRVAAVKDGLERMGIRVQEERSRLIISGATPKGATISSRDDHRIAMAFGVLGTVAGDTIIDGAECVSKTFPEFWEVLESLGGEVKRTGQ